MLKPRGECYTPISKKKQNPNSLCATEEMLDEQAHQNFLVNNFQGDTKYCLNFINSIFFKDGKIYNLLERNVEKKSLKCGCVKSYCQAKYCECFRNGQACGDECSCKQCKNKKSRKHMQVSLNAGCKCRKSGCSKKYCECYQNGKRCGSQCQCVNCCNVDA